MAMLRRYPETYRLPVYAALHAEAYGERVDALSLCWRLFMVEDRGGLRSRFAQAQLANRSCSDQPRSPR